jgi:hypothetical protein
MAKKNVAKRVGKSGGIAGMDASTLMAILSGDEELKAKIAAAPANQRARIIERELSKKSGASVADTQGEKPKTQKKPAKKGGERGKGVVKPEVSRPKSPTAASGSRSQGMLIAKRAFKAMKKSVPFETYRAMTPAQKAEALVSAIGKDKTVVGEVAEGVIIGIQQRLTKFATGSEAAKVLEKFGADRGVKGTKRAITAGKQASASGEKRSVASRRGGAGSTIKPDSSRETKAKQIKEPDAAFRRSIDSKSSVGIADSALDEQQKMSSSLEKVTSARAGKALFNGAEVKFVYITDGKKVKEVNYNDLTPAQTGEINSKLTTEVPKKGSVIVPMIKDAESGEWRMTPRRKTEKLGRIFERAAKSGKAAPKEFGARKGNIKDLSPIGERKLVERARSARGARTNRKYTDAVVLETVRANQEKARAENRKMLDKINAELDKKNLTPGERAAAKKTAMTKFHQEKAPIASPREIARTVLGVDDPAQARRVSNMLAETRIKKPDYAAGIGLPKKKKMNLKPQDPDEIKAGQKAKADRVMAMKNTPGDAAPERKPIVGKRKAVRIGKEVIATGTFSGPALRAPKANRVAAPKPSGKPSAPGVLSRESILAQLDDPKEKRQLKKVMKLSKDFTAPQMRMLEKRGVIKLTPKVKSVAKNLGIMGLVASALSQIGETKKKRG